MDAARRFSSDKVVEEVVLSHERFEQLLEAEITTLALQEARAMTLQSILDYTENAGELAALLYTELPTRYAQRIKMLESLPDWRRLPEIVHVRQMYVTSFKELRLVDASRPEVFPELLRRIKKRHLHTNLLVGGFKKLAQREELGEEQINEWLDRFFALRVSTHMLISHFLEMVRKETSFVSDSMQEADRWEACNPYQSAINPRCHPYRIAKHAADVIGQLCTSWYGCTPEIEVTDAGAQPFPFVPRYLFYILSELLKNAVRATIEHGSDGQQTVCQNAARMAPIRVLVCSSANTCSIRISDEGGGIPVDHLGHVWSYLYTTAAPVEFPMTRESVDAPTDLRRLEMSAMPNISTLHSLAEGDEGQNLLMRSPLAGLGCGLPLSRLYAQYFGGEVRLQTLPRFGTDVFVYLNRLGRS